MRTDAEHDGTSSEPATAALGAGRTLVLGHAPRPCAGLPSAMQLVLAALVQFAGSYIALDRGWWSEAGLNVSLPPPAGRTRRSNRRLSPAPRWWDLGADYTAAAVEEGAPFKILGVAMQKNPLRHRVAARQFG